MIVGAVIRMRITVLETKVCSRRTEHLGSSKQHGELDKRRTEKIRILRYWEFLTNELNTEQVLAILDTLGDGEVDLALGGNHTVGCPLLCADGETVFPNLGSSSQQMSSIEVLECAPTLNQLSPVTSV